MNTIGLEFLKLLFKLQKEALREEDHCIIVYVSVVFSGVYLKDLKRLT